MDFYTNIKSVKKKHLVVIALLSVSVVAIIFGLGLGLGLELDKCKNKVVEEVITSCANRCYAPFQEDQKGCHCDRLCEEYDNCCPDFKDICLKSAELWECTKDRCGESRSDQNKCHCSDDCLKSGDCCTNFKNVCQGEADWVSGSCEDITTASCPAGFSRQPVILISLDGFRAEYAITWKQFLPVITKLRTCGVYSPYMQAVYPTKTFTNHYSIVTGMYAESHGLIDNSMYDPVFNTSFSLSNAEKMNPDWYQGQPVWLTAMYQGLKAGTFFWPGSDVKINGTYPNLYMLYDGKVTFEERVHTLLKWLHLPNTERPDFYTLYLEEPDSSGHNHGPVSGGVVEALQGVDRIIGQLMNGLKQMGLHRCVNIVLVADHGMDSTSCKRMEYLTDYMENVNNIYVYNGANVRIRARNTAEYDTIDNKGIIANLTCKKEDQHFKPYLKVHLPKRFHYSNNRRIEHATIVVDEQWLVARKSGEYTYCDGGTHGYDNDFYSMHAVFVGYGPKLISQKEVEPFENIELYNLMCDLLEIDPAPNNGTHGSLNILLRKPVHTPQFPSEESQPGTCHMTSLIPTSNLSCSCSSMGADEQELNKRLNLTEVAGIEQNHLPFGRPIMLQPKNDYCLLYHSGYVNAFSKTRMMPAWTSFTIKKNEPSNPLPDVIPDCVRADVRIPENESPSCAMYSPQTITRSFLYPPNLNSSMEEHYDGLLISNVIPVYPTFQKIWTYFQNVLLMKYASAYNGVNVMSGPVFDYDYNGHFDSSAEIIENVTGTPIPIPTHYFIVLTSCKNVTETPLGCSGSLQAVAFILPHRADNSESCNNNENESEWVEDLMWFHKARIRDVEWITGLDFYQGSKRPVEELIHLKTRPCSTYSRVH